MIKKIIGIGLLAAAGIYVAAKKMGIPGDGKKDEGNTNNNGTNTNTNVAKPFIILDNPNPLQYKDMVDIYKERVGKEGKWYETIYTTEALIPAWYALKQGAYWELPENRNRADRKVLKPEKYVTVPRGTRFKAIIGTGQNSGVQMVVYTFNAGDGYPNNPIWHPILLSNVKESSTTTDSSTANTNTSSGSSFGSLSGLNTFLN